MSIQTFTTVYDQLLIENKLYFRHNGAPFICHYNSALFSPQMSSTRNNSIIAKCYQKRRKPYPYYFWCFCDIKTPQKQPRTRSEIYIKLRLSKVSEKKNGANQIWLKTIFIRHLARTEAQKCNDSTKLMLNNKKKKIFKNRAAKASNTSSAFDFD